MTTQQNFHPMKGDVYHGSRIQMENGDVLTLNDSMRGWTLYRDDEFVAGPFDGAYEVLHFIVNYEIFL